MIAQTENREVLEIICSKEDVLVAHYRVSGMNFIPGGYAVPVAVRDAGAEAKNQLIANAPTDTDTQPSSPNVDIEFGEDEQDEDEPSTLPEDVIHGNPDQCAMPPPQLQTPSASNHANLTLRKSYSLHVNIRDLPSEELI